MKILKFEKTFVFYYFLMTRIFHAKMILPSISRSDNGLQILFLKNWVKFFFLSRHWSKVAFDFGWLGNGPLIDSQEPNELILATTFEQLKVQKIDLIFAINCYGSLSNDSFVFQNFFLIQIIVQNYYRGSSIIGITGSKKGSPIIEILIIVVVLSRE